LGERGAGTLSAWYIARVSPKAIELVLRRPVVAVTEATEPRPGDDGSM
jgi:hypothetical protein